MILPCMQVRQPEDADFCIFVKTCNAGTRQLRVNGSHAVHELHQRINAYWKMPDFYLTSEGKVLDQHSTLSESGITKDATVVQRPRVRAGCPQPQVHAATPPPRCAKPHSQQPGVRGHSSKQVRLCSPTRRRRCVVASLRGSQEAQSCFRIGHFVLSSESA